MSVIFATASRPVSRSCKLIRRCLPVATTQHTRMTSTNSAGHLQYLERPGGNQISYRKTEGSNRPGVMFLPGFMSNMNGGKALALEKYCQQHGHPFVRFDYQGCGESIGHLSPGTKGFDVWKSDAQAVLDQLTSGLQILVGSSMGAAIMLLLALENPTRIQALLGVASAVSFQKPLLYTEEQDLAKEQSKEAKTEYVAPENFINMRYQRCLMDDAIPITKPVCLIHGMQDDTVPYMTSVDLSQRLQSKHVDVVLRKKGLHRMSEVQDLELLIQCLDNLIRLDFNSSSNL